MGNKDFENFDLLDEGPIRFYVEGLNCHHCLAKLRKVESQFHGIKSLQVNMGTKVLDIDLDRSLLPLSQFATKLNEHGFRLTPLKLSNEVEKFENRLKQQKIRQIGVAAAATANIMTLSIANYLGADKEYQTLFDNLSFLLFLPIFLYSALPFWSGLRQGWAQKKVTIDATIVLALLVGTLISGWHLIVGGPVYFDSMSMLITLLLASRYLLWQMQKNATSTQSLMDFITPRQVQVFNFETQNYELVNSQKLQVGDQVRIQPEETLAFDAQLLKNPAYFNTSVLTGESKPQHIRSGETIYAGTHLADGKSAEAIITALGEETRVGKLLKTLDDELKKPSRLLSLTDRAAQIFVVLTLLISGFALIYFATEGVEIALQRALAVVILACPCALALAVPLTQSLALKRAAELGVIIKNADVLEKLSRLKSIVFDKTGTLTTGHFEFIGWKKKEPSPLEKSILVALESSAQHPIAKSILKKFKNDDLEKIELEGWQEIPGVGVEASWQGDHYSVKSAMGTGDSMATRIGFFKNNTELFVGEFGDQIKPSAIDLCQNLSQNFELFLLSGDNKNSVENVAQKCGIARSRSFAQSSPEDKIEKVSQLNPCLMIGDGVNDSVALARAEIGLAVHGSMANSLKACDAYLCNEDLNSIRSLFEVSSIFTSTLKWNLLFSAVYNFVGVIAALLGYINPLVAAVLMPISSALVISSSTFSFRTKKFKQQRVRLTSHNLTQGSHA